MRRTVVGALALLGACSFEHGALQGDDGAEDANVDAGPTAPWAPGFLYRKPITITPPTLTAPLTNFPVGILAGTDPQLADSARNDGQDIIFTGADGTMRIDHELVTFDSTTGAFEAWVRMPQLPNGASTIFMYYGAAAQPPTAITTWPTTFAGVWHLDQGVAAADSTPHGHAAFAAAPLSTPAVVDGVAGHARNFDGVDDSMSIADPADGSLDFGMSSFSFSLWVDATASIGEFDAAMSKGGATTGEPGYCVLLGTSNWNVKAHDGSNYRDPVAGTETLHSWVYIAGVVDRTAQQIRAYRDGVFTDMAPLSGVGTLNNNNALTFGLTGVLMPYDGVLDEVRISAGTLSADWIAAEYANLKSPVFAVRGTQQARP
jgi:hypothetical protein